MKKEKEKKKGFTLVEMMVVIALGMILLVMALMSANKQRSSARNKVRVADIDTIRLAIEEYKLHCGEYPAKITLSTNNGCKHGEKMGDFLSNIPVNPREIENPYVSTSGIDGSGGYLYAALSASTGGKCYDYHIGTFLETDSKNLSYLQEDHDAKKGTGKYKYKCHGSKSDFSNYGETEDEKGLYDLRSKSNF